MKPWMLERMLWTITVSAGVMTAGQMLLNSKPSFLSETQLPSMSGVQMYDAAQLDEAADSAASTDPFRLDRHPSNPTLGGPPLESPSVAMSSPLQVRLSGVSGGPPWHAIVSGLPGHEGDVMVRAGDTLGEMRVRTIRRDTVIVQTKDSTITFTIRR